MSAVYKWGRSSRHRTRHAALRRRHELVRKGWRTNEVRVERIGEDPFCFAVMTRYEATA